MRQAKTSKWTLFIFMGAALALGSRLPAAQADAAARKEPIVESSYGDKQWRAAQAAARPWTDEEMASAISLDVPGVNEETLAKWADEAMLKSAYNTKGGPGFDAGAAPGGRVDRAAMEPLSGQGVEQAGMDKGYNYPPPYTRYEAFPNYTGYPHSTVGKVYFTKPGIGNFVCSASSVGGDAVITAAHCIHDSATTTFWTNWVFVPALKGTSKPFGQWTANILYYLSAYRDGGSGDSRYDIGGAVLNRNSGLKISQKVGFLGFAWNQSTTSTSAHWALFGYPQTAPFNGSQQIVCQASYAYNAGGSAPSPIAVGCDQTGGSSGGPWIRNYAGFAGASNYVNGVNSYRRCFDEACTSVYTQELFSPYFDNNAKLLKDCIVNSTPGHPAC